MKRLLPILFLLPILAFAQTPVTRYISPGATGTNDGESLANAYPDWVTAFTDIQADYTNFTAGGSNVVVTLRWNGGISSVNGSIDFTSTMDSTHYLTVIPDTAGDVNDTGIYDEQYPTLEGTAGNSDTIDIGAGTYVIFDGIQFSTGNTSDTSYVIFFDRAGDGTLIARNFHARMNGTLDTTVSSCSLDTFARRGGASTFILQNGVVEGFNVGLCHQSTSDGFTVSNVLIKGNTEDFRHTSTGRIIFKNTILEGNTTTFGTEVDTLSNYNSTDQATPPTNWGANSLDTQAVTFANEAGGNYQLNATDTALHTSGIGTTDSDIYATDRLGVARGSSTASMGPFEFVTAGGSSPVPVILQQH